MPADMNPEAAEHIKPLLKQVMGKILHGGGLGKAGLDFTSLYLSLQGVAMSYQLCIPPYFTNVLRAFGTLEGIVLKVDPDYSIVHECMPYLSRRLLTDNNPRMRAALRQLLYGDGQRLDVERLQSLISSFSNFSTSTSSSSSTNSSSRSAYAFEERVKGSTRFAAGSEGPVLNETMREALKVVFAKDGSYAQEVRP
jgi:aarF domain-containing kinase